MTTYILGVDGGNSKTMAALGDERGTVLGIGSAGGSNHQGLGLRLAMDRILEAAEGALGQAGAEPAEVALVYYSLAGADLPSDFDLLRPALEDLRLGGRVALHNDSMAALRSGTDSPNATVVSLGAGTVAMGRNAAGREVRLPALGWLSGDWGGGGDLAREAVWYTVRQDDGRGEPTMLHDMVLQELGLPDGEALVDALYHRRIDHREVLRLTPLVFEAAKAGDAVAVSLVVRQGTEAAVTARAMLRRLELLQTPADVVLAGSVFRRTRSKLLLDTTCEHLLEWAPLARVILAPVEPSVGALFCGMSELGLPVNEQIRSRAATSYETVSSTMEMEVAPS